jgi:hypothetical protein
VETINREISTQKNRFWHVGICHTLYFWPFIVMGGRIVARAVLNIWNMIEPGGADIQY